MRYAKLINGYPLYAPRRIKIGSVIVYNPTNAQLLADGYLPVVETSAPVVDELHKTTPHWTIQDNQIVQTWTIEELPTTEEEALTRYANSITGEQNTNIISVVETLINEKIKGG